MSRIHGFHVENGIVTEHGTGRTWKIVPKETTPLYEVADWFLSKDDMTHKKLQKLCYYAQAWYCTLYSGTPLFQEELQAWAHGPVVPDLYAKFKRYKWDNIPKVPPKDNHLSSKALRVLEAVYTTYGSLTGDALERRACLESPWIKARGSLKEGETSQEVISRASMIKCYSEQYERAQYD